MAAVVSFTNRAPDAGPKVVVDLDSLLTREVRHAKPQGMFLNLRFPRHHGNTLRQKNGSREKQLANRKERFRHGVVPTIATPATTDRGGPKSMLCTQDS